MARLMGGKIGDCCVGGKKGREGFTPRDVPRITRTVKKRNKGGRPAGREQ